MKKIYSVLSALAAASLLACLPAWADAKAEAPAKEAAPADEAPSGPVAVSGTVTEAINSGGYTYICVENNGQKSWVAVLQMKVKIGEMMFFRPGMVMTNFNSKGLNRTFPAIVFSDGPMDVGKESKDKMVKSQGAVKLAEEKIKVDKAAGARAYTVAELYEKAAALDKKEVIVKGKVMKVSANIMNKNWLHIQDGTGDSGKGNYDLVVTTKDSANTGDVVTITGTLVKDKDFGAGYNYKVIVEDAKVSK